MTSAWDPAAESASEMSLTSVFFSPDFTHSLLFPSLVVPHLLSCADMPDLIVLDCPSQMLPFFFFNKLKVEPSTSKTVMTHRIMVAGDRTCSTSEVLLYMVFRMVFL